MRVLSFAVLMICALAALVTQFPLSWAAKIFAPDDILIERYSGTVTQGTMFAPTLFGTAVFDANIMTRSADFKFAGPGFGGSGTVSRRALTEFRADGFIAALAQYDGRLANLSGRYRTEITRLDFGENGALCHEASGSLFTDVLQANAAYWQWRGPVLRGPVTCEDGAIKVSLSGQSDDRFAATVRGDIVVQADMTYRLDITVQTPEPRAGAILPLYGFDAAGGGTYRLSESGRLR